MANNDADIDFDALKQMGTKKVYDTPRIQFADLRFATPSGKIEIASESAERDGCWRTPKPHADPIASNGRVRILSPASEWILNTTYGNDARIRQRMGRHSVLINPADAVRYQVGVRNAGTWRLSARPSPRPRPNPRKCRGYSETRARPRKGRDWMVVDAVCGERLSV